MSDFKIIKKNLLSGSYDAVEMSYSDALRMLKPFYADKLVNELIAKGVTIYICPVCKKYYSGDYKHIECLSCEKVAADTNSSGIFNLTLIKLDKK